MIIHVVKPGESLYTIAKLYGVSYTKIAADNEVTNIDRLVVGQTLVILQENRTHKVVSGDSIYKIAGQYNVSVNRILAANPQITNPAAINVGDVINIPTATAKLGTFEVNGYAFPNITMEVLKKTLPHLTYLSIFSYQAKADGTFAPINDEVLIREARAAKVAPLMVINNIDSDGGFSSELAASILRNPEVQNTLINNIMANLKAKNYFGLDIDFEYIFPQDRENYNNFLRKISARLNAEGYILATALAPKTSADQTGILYQGHDYPVHGALANHVIIMTYEWGYTYGPPQAVAPLNEVRKVLEYAVSAIPRKKILMGIPNYGYDWTLPYVPGSAAQSISNTEAVNRAARYGAVIQFDPVAAAPFYNYYDANGKKHVVWFEDARSIKAKLELASEFGLGGVSYWTINRYFPQNWLVLQSLYNVRKVI